MKTPQEFKNWSTDYLKNYKEYSEPLSNLELDIEDSFKTKCKYSNAIFITKAAVRVNSSSLPQLGPIGAVNFEKLNMHNIGIQNLCKQTRQKLLRTLSEWPFCSDCNQTPSLKFSIQTDKDETLCTPYFICENHED